MPDPERSGAASSRLLLSQEEMETVCVVCTEFFVAVVSNFTVRDILVSCGLCTHGFCSYLRSSPTMSATYIIDCMSSARGAYREQLQDAQDDEAGCQ
jgi:hypothetical protein